MHTVYHILISVDPIVVIRGDRLDLLDLIGQWGPGRARKGGIDWVRIYKRCTMHTLHTWPTLHINYALSTLYATFPCAACKSQIKYQASRGANCGHQNKLCRAWVVCARRKYSC